VSDERIVIVGGGLVGLFTAYHLLKLGYRDITIIDRKYIGYGASNRGTGGLLHIFEDEDLAKLACLSVNIWKKLDEEIVEKPRPVPLRTGGHLHVATSKEGLNKLDKLKKILRRTCGVGEILTPPEVKEKAPIIDEDEIYGALYDPLGSKVLQPGVVRIFEFYFKLKGLKLMKYNPAKNFKVEGSRVKTVITEHGEIEADKVVITAGAFTKDLACKLDERIPLCTFRGEEALTEGIHYEFEPFVTFVENNFEFTQTWPRGEFIMGISNTGIGEPAYDLRASLSVLEKIAEYTCRYFPKICLVNVLRQWAGVVDVTPDNIPIISKSGKYENLWYAAGFGTRGITLSAGAGKALAEMVAYGSTKTISTEKFSIERFAFE